MSDTVLVCTDLEKRFGDVRAVNGISFRIDAGETFGLLGPNGAGKTTTISMVCGLLDGVARRMLSTPTSVRTILTGQTIGRLTVALLQALIIVLGSALFFGVRWGDPAGTTAVVIAFCLVGAGAGMLIGSVFSNEEQAGPVSILIGLGLAALGGSMVPLEVFPPAVRSAAHVTPHAWGNDAFSTLLRHGGGRGDVLGDVAVLFGFAAVLIALGTWRLRRALTA